MRRCVCLALRAIVLSSMAAEHGRNLGSYAPAGWETWLAPTKTSRFNWTMARFSACPVADAGCTLN